MTLNTIRSSVRAAAGAELRTAHASSSQTGAPPAAPQRGPDSTWRRFESLIAARGVAAAPMAQDGDAASWARAPQSPTQPPVGPQPVAPVVVAPPPAAHRRRGAWFYRFQGAAFTCVLALAAIAAARMPEAQRASPGLASGRDPGPAAAISATVDQSTAFADAFAQTARGEPEAGPQQVAAAAVDSAPVESVPVEPAPVGGAGVADGAPEGEVIARIAAAEPPYRVVLNVAPDANPRDVARLDTAIRAWGFVQPEQRVAAEPVTLPEVVFHAGQDRETALIVARIAERILAEAVLTPPGEAESDPARAGLIEINVTTR